MPEQSKNDNRRQTGEMVVVVVVCESDTEVALQSKVIKLKACDI